MDFEEFLGPPDAVVEECKDDIDNIDSGISTFEDAPLNWDICDVSINASDKKYILEMAKEVFKTLRDGNLTQEQLINKHAVGSLERYKWMLTFTLFDFYDMDFSAKLSSVHNNARLTCPCCHGPPVSQGPVWDRIRWISSLIGFQFVLIHKYWCKDCKGATHAPGCKFLLMRWRRCPTNISVDI